MDSSIQWLIYLGKINVIFSIVFYELILETNAGDLCAGSCLKGVNEEGHAYEYNTTSSIYTVFSGV